MRINRVVGCSTPASRLNPAYFEEYRAAGIRAMEMSVALSALETINLSQVAKDAAAAELDLWSFHLPFYGSPFANIARRTPEDCRNAIHFFSEWIKRAADAGFKLAVIHPSSEPIAPDTRELRKANSAAAIAELSRLATDCGMRLAVEDLPRTCLGNCSSELLELLRDAPDAGVCFDTNHLLFENHLDFLTAVADRLVTLHVSDYDFIDERHWLPGEGDVDWVALMDQLDKVGYTGPLMYEVGIGSSYRMQREHPITPREFAKNAEELFRRAPLTQRGFRLM